MAPLIRKNKLVTIALVLNALLLVVPAVVWPQFVPGQMIVKFVQGTEGSKAVNHVIQSSPLDYHTLTPIIDHLQSEIGIPLEVTQITSGQRIVLNVESGVLTDRVAGQLTIRPNVADVEVIPRDPTKHGQIPSQKTIVVTFTQDSPESTAILRRTEKASDPRFLKMVSELEQFIGLPLTGEVYEANMALLQINLQKLTMILIERLQQLVYIESAQPNYIMRIR